MATSILITGNKGFIGSRLAARLRSEKFGAEEWNDDIRTIAGHKRAVDVVVHLAAIVNYDQFIAAPLEGYAVNVLGTLAVLNYCQRVGARCVFASTSGIYRAPKSGCPLTEDAPAGPSNPYSLSKWLAEELCRRQADDLGVPSVVLRLFNVYGQGQHPAFVVQYVVDCLTQHKQIALRMPAAERDLIYVDDVVDALIRAARFDQPGFHVFNIGSGKATQVIDLLHTAEEVFGNAIGIDAAAPHPGEAPVVVADTTRAAMELGWTPHYDLRTGLAAMKAARVGRTR